MAVCGGPVAMASHWVHEAAAPATWESGAGPIPAEDERPLG